MGTSGKNPHGPGLVPGTLLESTVEVYTRFVTFLILQRIPPEYARSTRDFLWSFILFSQQHSTYAR